jgi:hypothetical protein
MMIKMVFFQKQILLWVHTIVKIYHSLAATKSGKSLTEDDLELIFKNVDSNVNGFIDFTGTFGNPYF